MFTDKIGTIVYNEVKTIGGKDFIPKGIGTVIWSWIDDERKLHTNKLNNLLYLTDSPVNILSAIALAEYMKDDEGTWLLTKRKYSIITLDFGKLKKIANSKTCFTRIRDPRWI